LGYDGFRVVKDFWQYDPSTDAWTKLNDYTGPDKQLPVSFVVNNKGYVGLGANANFTAYQNDFWQYDPTSLSVQTHSQKHKISTYPNPTSGLTRFISESPLIGSSLEIYNMKGQLVDTFSFDDKGNEINFQDYGAGVYWWSVKENGSQLSNGKVVVY